jgi:hypothetical protein
LAFERKELTGMLVELLTSEETVTIFVVEAGFVGGMSPMKNSVPEEIVTGALEVSEV